MEQQPLDDDVTYAQTLEGRTLDNGWHVDRLIKSNEISGGYNSVSYEVSRNLGEKGFLKVYDFQAVLRAAQVDPGRKTYGRDESIDFCLLVRSGSA